MDTTQLREFVDIVWGYYAQQGRHDLPWRMPEPDGSFDPYKILVSELMLQQTQVARVIPKYYEFLAKFPDAAELAQASLGEVLITWSGLGYNRRAKYLWQAAQLIQTDFAGMFPHTMSELVRLPGVGRNTAGAIVAYAYNQPAIFIETNIRTVIIHHFFKDQTNISDAQIDSILEQIFALEITADYRQFYWAIMDYGTHLKQTVGNVSRASSSYSRQSPFHGSKRQLRGQVLKLLATKPLTQTDLLAALPDARTPAVLADLTSERMIAKTRGFYQLA
jgi:A/G-specific adenine glycosylase